jgi:transcriptional regulator with GAF, ATPase, and Fis domain
MAPIGDDITRLRACVRDLASLSALPLVWVGRSAADVVGSFLDIMLSGLRLDCIYARVHDPEGGSLIEAARLGGGATGLQPHELDQAFSSKPVSPVPALVSVPHRGGTIRIAVIQMDISGASPGVVVVGSQRSDFPTDIDTVFLGAAINQAAISLRSIRAAAEHRRVQRLQQQLEAENAYLREQADTALAFGRIVGQSAALRKLLPQVETVAATDATVLLLGESGSGKELFAKEIHARSRRAQRPLIAVNCSAIPKEMFESEFFGHVRGAYTGALRDRPGRFRLAHEGTIFLDEVGDIPLELQPKLLRVLQEGQYERVGDDTTRQVDVRVIAATNRNLAADISAGRFREDLYYRLSVFPLHVPSLRERREDIPRLAAHLVALAAKKLGRPEPRISERQYELLQSHTWPGNVRELQNLIERAVILSRSDTLYLDPAWLPENAYTQRRLPASARVDVVPENERRHQERENILQALRRSSGRIYGPNGAAKLLGLKPSTLQSRLRALGIQARQSEPPP